MFSLHETTQRRVCRVLFVVCCVVPTLLTVSWIAYFYRPWRLADWQQTLNEQLHVHASVAEIASPQPGLTTLTNVQLADLRSGNSLGRFDELRCRWQGSRLLLSAELLEIEVMQLPKVAEALVTWLSNDSPLPVEIHVDRVVFFGGPFDSATWQNLWLTSETLDAAGGRIKMEVNPTPADLPAQLVVEHRQQPAGFSIHATLDTQETAFPAWVLADLVPGGVHRSPAAIFKGSIQMEWLAQRLGGTLQGHFAGVDLAQWLGSNTPHRLQGFASLQLQNLTWQDNRIRLAEGRLQAQRGAANASLLEAAHQRLECAKTSACARKLAMAKEELVPFDQLDFSFRLDSTGLSLTSQGLPGSLLVHQGEPLLLQPASKLPVTRLVRLLYLPVAGWLPDTQEAHEMAGGLPLPKSVRQ